MWIRSSENRRQLRIAYCARGGRSRGVGTGPKVSNPVERQAFEAREERRDPLYYRLLSSFTLGSYEGSPGAARREPEKKKYGVLSPKAIPRAMRKDWLTRPIVNVLHSLRGISTPSGLTVRSTTP
jgi:hypothetical protein